MENEKTCADMKITHRNFIIYDMTTKQKDNGYVLTAEKRSWDEDNGGNTVAVVA